MNGVATTGPTATAPQFGWFDARWQVNARRRGIEGVVNVLPHAPEGAPVYKGSHDQDSITITRNGWRNQDLFISNGKQTRRNGHGAYDTLTANSVHVDNLRRGDYRIPLVRNIRAVNWADIHRSTVGSVDAPYGTVKLNDARVGSAYRLGDAVVNAERLYIGPKSVRIDGNVDVYDRLLIDGPVWINGTLGIPSVFDIELRHPHGHGAARFLNVINRIGVNRVEINRLVALEPCTDEAVDYLERLRDQGLIVHEVEFVDPQEATASFGRGEKRETWWNSNPNFWSRFTRQA